MPATPSRIQSATGLNTTFVSTVSATFGSPNASGNTLMLAVEIDTGAVNSANTPTDTAGNTYQRILSRSVAATFNLEIWVAYNCRSGSNTVTVTDSGGGVDSIVVVEEWAGISSVQRTDNATSINGSSTSLNSGSITTQNTLDVIWCAGVASNASASLSLGTGFSNLVQNNTGFTNLGCSSLISTTTNAYSGLFTATPSAVWICAVVALRAGYNNSLGAHISVGNGMSRSEVSN